MYGKLDVTPLVDNLFSMMFTFLKYETVLHPKTKNVLVLKVRLACCGELYHYLALHRTELT